MFTDEITDAPDARHPLLLEVYDLSRESPDWQKCFLITKPYLFGKKGLQEGIAYLDGVLARNPDEDTRKKYQEQRNAFQCALDDKIYTDRDCEPDSE